MHYRPFGDPGLARLQVKIGAPSHSIVGLVQAISRDILNKPAPRHGRMHLMEQHV